MRLANLVKKGGLAWLTALGQTQELLLVMVFWLADAPGSSGHHMVTDRERVRERISLFL
jgi:hypothetical protein